LDELLHLFFGDPRHTPGHGSQCPGGVGLASRERQDECGQGGEQHGADHRDRDVGAVEAVEGDRYHESHPEHRVEDDGRTDSLSRQRESGIGAAHPARGKEPVTEAGAASGAAGDHVAHGECRQVDTEHSREVWAVFWQHRLREAPVCDERSRFEGEPGEEPREIDAAQLAQR